MPATTFPETAVASPLDADRIGVLASVLCAIHCAVTPLLLLILPSLHPVFGDRSCELTLIGHARDLEIFGRELLDCFCTEEEIEHWQQGGIFPDPWPANLKVMR